MNSSDSAVESHQASGREDAPPHEWVLERARLWSSRKDEDSVRALAWNFLGMWREWQALAAPTRPAPEPAKPNGMNPIPPQGER